MRRFSSSSIQSRLTPLSLLTAHRFAALAANTTTVAPTVPRFATGAAFFKSRWVFSSLFGFGTAAASLVAGSTAFVLCAPAGGEVDWSAVRSDIVKLLEKDGNKNGPVLIRLAWHEAGTWDPKAANKGCPNSASMQFKPESEYGANAGLKLARDLLEPIKKKHPNVSRADLWALAAGVAVEEMGGPRIAFRAGRTDATSGEQCSPDGRLPDAAQTQDHVRELFVKRMGFTEAETVALIGAHTVGECHADRSGYVGPWSHDKLGFDNSYYSHLLDEEWIVDTRYKKLQFTDRATKKLMMLPGDVAFIVDPAFKKHVKRFAENQDVFHAEFATAFQKLLELGTSNLKPVTF